MPFQNRVTPFGEIVALPGRGLVLGNRGILHADAKNIVRYSQVRRWIACRLAYKGIRRTIMRPHSWTELFFLDEATAFSAGHRPCAECRREDYRRFRDLWVELHGTPAGADDIDRRLHDERLAGRRTKRTYRADLSVIPDGTYVAVEDRAWLVLGDGLFAWSSAGYTHRQPRPARREVDVLTPASIVAVLAAGYGAAVHPSVTLL
jgi:hypothetical protein